jgi:tetratricopeptide (TPR) repeat protein
MNIDMLDVAQFMILADSRIVRDRSVGLSQEVRKANFEQDRDLVRQRYADLIAYIEDPASIVYKDDLYSVRDGVTVGRWFKSQKIPIDEAIITGEGRFIDGSDPEALENYWAEKFQKDGDYDAVINGPLERHKKSETYIQALRLKFDVEPSYELAMKIFERSLAKAEQRNLSDANFKDAILYLERAFKLPDFTQQSSFAQARLYLNMMKLQLSAKRTKNATTYLNKAKKACTGYPDVYYYEATLLSERNFGASEYVTGIKFCAVYDLYSQALKKLKDLAANPNSEITTALTEEDIKAQMSWCEMNFMSQGEAFANGIYESGKVKRKIGEYTTVVRF